MKNNNKQGVKNKLAADFLLKRKIQTTEKHLKQFEAKCFKHDTINKCKLLQHC